MNRAQLQAAVQGGDLVFFVGAGISRSGNTGFPLASTLLSEILVEALARIPILPRIRLKEYLGPLRRAAQRVALELALDDLRLIAPAAVRGMFDALGRFEMACSPNSAHQFLARYVAEGGVVLTTNWDRMIERAAVNPLPTVHTWLTHSSTTRQSSQQPALKTCLFKLHGSLDDTASCLGALEDVGTIMEGVRVRLLQEIIETRPLCFVGWKGADPDIPVVLNQSLSSRRRDVPTFWIHHIAAGTDDDVALKTAVEAVPALVRPYAAWSPIAGEAKALFDSLMAVVFAGSQTATGQRAWVGPAEVLSLSAALDACTVSGAARFLGIVLGRAAEYPTARRLLRVAWALGNTADERSCALLEQAHLRSLQTRLPSGSRRLIRRAQRELADDAIGLRLNAYLELLMTMSNVSNLAARRTGKWHQVLDEYEHAIREADELGPRNVDVPLHSALLEMFRAKVALGQRVPRKGRRASTWNIAESHAGQARTMIDGARPSRVGNRIDVLMFSVSLYAAQGRAKEVAHDFEEIDRLCVAFGDARQRREWKRIRPTIVRDL